MTADMAESTAGVLKSALSLLPLDIAGAYRADIKQLIDDSKVSDHHAIIPTSALGNTPLENLPKGEQDLLKLIAYD